MQNFCINFAALTTTLHMESIDNIRQAGMKLTPQRTAVYKAMMALRPARLETIVDHLKNYYDNCTLSTVYRILESFCDAGLLSVVCHPDTGDCYYDITVSDHHHVFSEGNIIDLKDDELTQLVKDYIRAKRPEISGIEKIQVHISLK